MPKCLYALILFCVLSRLSTAQESKRITTDFTDTAYINRYIRETDQLSNADPDSAVVRYRYTLSRSKLIHFDPAAAYCLAKIGEYYVNHKQNYPLSLAYLYQALSYCEKLKPEYYWLIPVVYNLLGGVYFHTGKNDSAISSYMFALRVMDSLSLDMPGYPATVYGNIGSVLSASYQHRQGTGYIKKAIVLQQNMGAAKRRDDSMALARNYGNLAGVYANYLDDMDTALYYWSYALDLYRQLSVKEPLQMVYANISRGWLIHPHFDLLKAERYMDTAISIDPARSAYNINILAVRSDIYYYKGQYRQAIKTATLLLKLCNASGGRRGQKDIAFRVLSYSYAHLGDGKHSQKYQQLWGMLSDSLFNEKISRSISQLEVQYRISEKDKNLAENRTALYRQRNWLIGSIGGGLILLLALLGFLRNSRQKQRLYQEQLQNLQQQKKIEHLHVKMEAEEQERKRIARELHDGLGVLLSAAKINHTLMGKLLPSSLLSDASAYRRSHEILRQMQQEIKTMANNLVPDYFTDKSFEETLETLADRFNDPGVFSISVYSYGELQDLHPERSFALYRVIEEIINNAVKHSGGQELFIQLMYHQDQLHITIEDNGKGFDPQKRYAGMGLQNIKSRIDMLKGYLNLSSDKENGTTYTLEIPY